MHQTLRTMSFAVILSCAGIYAHAQTPPQRQDLPPLRERQELSTASKLNLSLEQRHTIREFIKDVKGEATPRDVHASVGDTVPQDVSLQPMPTLVGQKVQQVKTHRFFVTGQQIVIVDPKDNKVADVINLTDN